MMRSVQLRDLGDWARNLPKERHAAAVDAVRKVMNERGRVIVNEEINATTPRRPFDRGDYSRSWFALPIADGGRLYSKDPKASVIERGRRPGTFPPIGPLIGWAHRHGMEPAKSAAFAIAVLIKKRGLPAKHVFTRASKRLVVLCTQAARAALSGGGG